MNIHEYQAKAILKTFDVAVPRGRLARSGAEAEAVARELGGSAWVVKAQIHAGGRGKGGGVKLCTTVEEVSNVSEAMIGMNLVTHQTGPGGKEVDKVYIEEGCDLGRELYLALLLDRKAGRLSFVSSTEGGVDIEAVADATPDKILREIIDPASGMVPDHARKLAVGLGLNKDHTLEAEKFIGGVYNAFTATDATLIEINPMVVTSDSRLLALDAKINFDDNALFRHPELVELRDENEEDPLEREAQQHDLSYIKLEGNIGCMVNGAGLAMATMDIIKLYGGKPANFLDVGGGADEQRVTKAFKIILSDPNVEAILVNIFGGIMRCDVIAEGIVAAAREVSMNVPLVVRLEGTNVDLGKQILARSGVTLVTADDLGDAAAKVVRAVGKAR